MFANTSTGGLEKTSVTKGLLLLALTVMGNYVAETLGCSTQKMLTKNRIAKHVVILFLIYFTLNITNDNSMHPVYGLGLTIVLFICFIIFTKMSTVATVIVFSSLCLHYILGNFITYYHTNGIHTYDTILNTLDTGLFITITVSTIIGFISYIRKEYREHKNFDLLKFFIGVDKCRA